MDLLRSYEYFQPDKNDCRIHIIGCGSVGSTVAENLARSGLKNFSLWDFDKVEPHNLTNQMFREKDIGKTKVEALLDILTEINPEIKKTAKLFPKGWDGQTLSGYVFLCADSMEVRRGVVSKHMNNDYVKAMFDFRTGLEDAQHYGADWSIPKDREALWNSMQFSDEEAKAATPVSACNTPLSVAPTIRMVVAAGVANFQNGWNGKKIHRMIIANPYSPSLAFI